MTFETMKNAFNLREKNKIDEARKTLNDMKTFYVNDLEKKNIKKLNDYISKFDSSLNLMTNDELFNNDGEAIMMGNIREGQRKVGGSDLFYSNQLQKNLIAKVTG